MIISVKLEGADKLDKMLSKVSYKVEKKITLDALKAGGKVVAVAQKSNARSMVGGTMGKQIARFISVRKQKRTRRGEIGALTLIRKQGNKFFIHAAKGGKRSYIPAALEYGHDQAKPIPFMRNAWHRTKRKALDVILKTAWAGIKREAKAK